MASSFQRQSQIRKASYGALILALFTVSLFWRQFLEKQAAPPSEENPGGLSLREQSMGDVELSGSFVRLTLIGSRGVAQCWLWWKANELQKRHEWNKLELAVAWITRLQPHYKTPWQFQGWNLAYNVPAECDRVKDKYYFIARGIALLAEGERQNRNNPELRYDVAFMLQNKIGMADEQHTLRTLFQLSCIDPAERDPSRLRRRDGSVNPEGFERFCRKYPHLVRRLHDRLACNTPDEVIDFLTENYEIPSRYEYPSARGRTVASRPLPAEGQFPVLPRRSDVTGLVDIPYTADDAELPAEFDNFAAAAIWFTYAQAPLPPPNPGGSPLGLEYDLRKYRLPRKPSLIIFRNGPPRALSYVAERMQKEGWFDRGWEVDEGRQGIHRWFPGRQVVLGGGLVPGQGTNWSAQAWEKARERWEKHGRDNGLYIPPEKRGEIQTRAQAYRKEYGIAEAEKGPELRPEHLDNETMRASFEAHRQLYWSSANLNLTNFTHFHTQARNEVQPGAITARRLFFKAEQMHNAAMPAGDVVKAYEEALLGPDRPRFAETSTILQTSLLVAPLGHPLMVPFSATEDSIDGQRVRGWRKILQDNEDFRKDKDVQEESYTLQYKYLKLLQEEERGRLAHLKPLLVMGDFLAKGVRPPGAILWLPTADVIPPRSLGSGIVGPLDGNARDGKPFLGADAIRLARTRLGFNEPLPQTQTPMPAPPKRR